MKIALCITNHDQNRIIESTLKKLKRQTQAPDQIFVCSDGQPFEESEGVIAINNEEGAGRCKNRNSVVREFLDSECDAIIFIDGDSYPKSSTFIQKYEDELENFDLVFGTRIPSSPRHQPAGPTSTACRSRTSRMIPT